MGPLKGVMKLMPGIGRSSTTSTSTTRQMARVEAIVLSMTPHERRVPHLINGPSRRRIAAGSGTTIEDVNRLLQARKQMEKVMKSMGKGKMLPPSRGAREASRQAAAGRGHRWRDDAHATSTACTRGAAEPSGTIAVAPTTKGIFEGMAVRMRLTRVGSKKNPIYRVVVADSRSPRDGRFIEIVGRYNPQTDPSTIDLDAEKVKDWLAKGAQPSDPVARLIKAAGIE